MFTQMMLERYEMGISHTSSKPHGAAHPILASVIFICYTLFEDSNAVSGKGNRTYLKKLVYLFHYG